MRIFKFLLLFIILFFALFNCKTINDLVINSLSETSLKKIEEIDILILKYKSSKDIQYLKEALIKSSDLEKEAKKNKYYESKIFGLYGEIYFLQGDILSTKKYTGEIEKRNPNEERLFILKAEIEKDINKKEAIIKTGIEKTNESNLLKLFLAELYFVKGKFPEATALYDESLINLSADFKNFYKKRRDLSYQLIKTPPKNINSITLLMKDEISTGDLILIIVNEFPSFKKIFDSSNIELKTTYDRLKNDNYFYSFPNIELKLDDKIKRKDVAYFLLKTISVFEKKPELLNKYNKITANNDKQNLTTSPVPDIKTSDYFFTAVLVLVEREIMDLPDGKNFKPDNTVNGMDFVEMIRKMARFY